MYVVWNKVIERLDYDTLDYLQSERLWNGMSLSTNFPAPPTHTFQNSGIYAEEGGRLEELQVVDDAKETVCSRYNRLMDICMHRDCDSVYKTCIGSNQTKSQQEEWELDTKSQCEPRSYLQLTPIGEGIINFL